MIDACYRSLFCLGHIKRDFLVYSFIHSTLQAKKREELFESQRRLEEQLRKEEDAMFK